MEVDVTGHHDESDGVYFGADGSGDKEKAASKSA
ncbi:hypothetical protein CCP4SC76_1270005 [Gammaproteobacteria bacterium]